MEGDKSLCNKKVLCSKLFQTPATCKMRNWRESWQQGGDSFSIFYKSCYNKFTSTSIPVALDSTVRSAWAPGYRYSYFTMQFAPVPGTRVLVNIQSNSKCLQHDLIPHYIWFFCMVGVEVQYRVLDRILKKIKIMFSLLVSRLVDSGKSHYYSTSTRQ